MAATAAVPSTNPTPPQLDQLEDHLQVRLNNKYPQIKKIVPKSIISYFCICGFPSKLQCLVLLKQYIPKLYFPWVLWSATVKEVWCRSIFSLYQMILVRFYPLRPQNHVLLVRVNYTPPLMEVYSPSLMNKKPLYKGWEKFTLPSRAPR